MLFIYCITILAGKMSCTAEDKHPEGRLVKKGPIKEYYEKKTTLMLLDQIWLHTSPPSVRKTSIYLLQMEKKDQERNMVGYWGLGPCQLPYAGGGVYEPVTKNTP
jgi:hypothetical protein